MNIKWNKVTPFSKIVALVLFVALPFVGFWLGIGYGRSIQTLNDRAITRLGAASALQGSGYSADSGYYANVAVWQTDQNTSGGFSIAHPLDFTVDDNYSLAPSTEWRWNSNNEPGIQYATLTIPSAFEPQTNFDDATLTVGASGNDIAVSECLTPDASGGPAESSTTETINGIPFTAFHSDGVGAGNYYETTSYRALHAGKCYAVEYTIHSGQIMNYPSAYELQPFNEGMLTDVLNRIVGTFTFL